MKINKRTCMVGIMSLAVGLAVITVFCAGKRFLPNLFGPTGEFSEHHFEKTVNRTFSGNYLLHLPEDYDEAEDPLPLILYLHGTGERGNMEKLRNSGLIKALGQFTPPEPFIILAPICPKDTWWTDATNLEMVLAMLDEVCQSYRIDRTRIYLTGISMGGFGAWELGIQHPELFAAVVPISAGGNPYLTYRLKHVPVRVYHGQLDKTVPPVRATEMVATLRNSGGKVDIFIYPNLGHDVWDQTYKDPKFYDWLLNQRRGSPSPPDDSD